MARLRSHPEILVLLGIPERVHRILTLLHQTNIVFQHLSELNDADIRAAQVLPRTIRDLALSDPGGRVLGGVAIQQLPTRLIVLVQMWYRDGIERNVLGALV